MLRKVKAWAFYCSDEKKIMVESMSEKKWIDRPDDACCKFIRVEICPLKPTKRKRK